MTLQEALEILGAQPGEKMGEIRARHRRLMAQLHPDVRGGSAQELARAQQVNAAYTLVRGLCARQGEEILRRPARPGRGSGRGYSAPVNPLAFCARSVYVVPDFSMIPGAGEGDARPQLRGRGRYLWDPDRETFPLLCRSVGECATALLQEIALSCGAGAEAGQVLMGYRERLFHALMQDFVEPVLALRRFLVSEGRDRRGRDRYRLGALLQVRGAERIRELCDPLQEGIGVELCVRGERLWALDEDGRALGWLSFSEDALYYLLPPLIATGQAQVRARVREVRRQEHERPLRALVRLSLEVLLDAHCRRMSLPSHAVQIRGILAEAQGELRARRQGQTGREGNGG